MNIPYKPNELFWKTTFRPKQWHLFEDLSIDKIVDFVCTKNKHLQKLSKNPRAIRILKQYPHIIYWKGLSKNKYAIDLLNDNYDKIVWDSASQNTNIMMIKNIKYDELNWYKVSANPGAIPLLEQFPDKINLCGICHNKNAKNIIINNIHNINIGHLSLNPVIVDIINEYTNMIKNAKDAQFTNSSIKLLESTLQYIYDNINHRCISQNTKALNILKEHPEFIDNMGLCMNKNPQILKLINDMTDDDIDVIFHEDDYDDDTDDIENENEYLKQLAKNPYSFNTLNKLKDMNIDNLSDLFINCSYNLWHNKNAYDILINDPGCIDIHIKRNPCIFDYDYDQMKINKAQLHKELLDEVLSPERITIYKSKGYKLCDTYY